MARLMATIGLSRRFLAFFTQWVQAGTTPKSWGRYDSFVDVDAFRFSLTKRLPGYGYIGTAWQLLPRARKGKLHDGTAAAPTENTAIVMMK
ncbi:hypothetical protein RvY_17554 [Ramazzottius varieornatus]|uniref:Uncharacterized protein n=1 Tax=Ramazzottius varieornatus TaxID=947166 RepID=A0A1D1W2J6_RAMVA|nr:hypothetical protein RvY_17554 [Ramazzottius varieornatus]